MFIVASLPVADMAFQRCRETSRMATFLSATVPSTKHKTSNISAAVPKSIYSVIGAKKFSLCTDPRNRVETIDVSVHTADDVLSRGMIKLSVRMQHRVGYNSIVAGGGQRHGYVSEYSSTRLARLDDTSLQNLIPKLGPESTCWPCPAHLDTLARSRARD